MVDTATAAMSLPVLITRSKPSESMEQSEGVTSLHGASSAVTHGELTDTIQCLRPKRRSSKSRKKHLTASDFSRETLITYPIPDERLDLIRQVLGPAGITPERRTATLTEAVLQLVASSRGISALPAWAIQQYLDREYVAERPITAKGLPCELYAATTTAGSQASYMTEFIKNMRDVCFRQLEEIEQL